MRIQLWSYNYDPEPTGIAPLSATLAKALAARGHEIDVVAAHPHYPEPRWGTRLRPYRETRDGIGVLRLPIWPGRDGALQRIRQELSFVAPLTAALPFLGRPEILLCVSPSFPALAQARAFARMRRIPWVLWLQDILPDGATASGILEDGALIAAARRFEASAYRSAARIVVISDSFRDNLTAKGVPEQKIVRAYNPASRPLREAPRDPASIDPVAVLNMGNIGRTQNLEAFVRAFEANEQLTALGANLTMAGDGVAAAGVRAAIETDRVRVTGVLGSAALGELLDRAAVGVVTQSYDGIDFNVPSKLMNFMGSGTPVIAAVRPESEVARLVDRSGGGWVTTSSEDAAAELARVLREPLEREERGRAALAFAQRHFSPQVLAERIEQALEAALSG